MLFYYKVYFWSRSRVPLAFAAGYSRLDQRGCRGNPHVVQEGYAFMSPYDRIGSAIWL